MAGDRLLRTLTPAGCASSGCSSITAPTRRCPTCVPGACGERIRRRPSTCFRATTRAPTSCSSTRRRLLRPRRRDGLA
jgi:hypothetical protein